jgi:hypothetical protein
MLYRIIISTLLFLCFGQIFTQGLNFEISLNPSYNQTPQGIYSDNGITNMVYSVSDDSAPYNALIQIDSNGNIIWSTLVVNYHGITLKNLFRDDNNNVYVLFNGRDGCDFGYERDFINKYNSSGILIESTTYIVNDYPYSAISDMNFNSSSNTFIYNKYYDGISTIIKKIGAVYDSISIEKENLYGLEEIGGYYILGYFNNTLFGIDNFGTVQDSMIFTQNIESIKSYNGSIYCLTNDSLHVLDNTFNLIDSRNYTTHTNLSNLKVIDAQIQFQSQSTSKNKVITIDATNNIVDTDSVDIYSNANRTTDFSKSEIIDGAHFVLSGYNSAWIYSHSRLSSQNANRVYPEIALIDIDTYAVNINQSNGDLRASINCLIKNTGNDTINSFRLNHFITSVGPLCGDAVANTEFTNLSLAPGDSIWKALPNVLIDWYGLPDTLTYNICAYTSHPNRNNDTIISNDYLCEQFHFGFLSLESNKKPAILFYPNPTSNSIYIEGIGSEKFTIQVFDQLGRLHLNQEINNNLVNLANLSNGIYLLQLRNSHNEVILSDQIIKR